MRFTKSRLLNLGERKCADPIGFVIAFALTLAGGMADESMFVRTAAVAANNIN